MKRVIIPMAAVSGFLMIWLGMTPEVENEMRTSADVISLSAAQAERVGSSEADASNEASKDAPKEASSEPGASCLPAQALSDLSKRRTALEKRESDLQIREQELSSREKAIAEQIQKLESMRQDIAKVDSENLKEFEVKITRTVELLESMNPKAASALVSSTDERLAVEAMARMSTAKLSKIMNVMEPKRSVRLMELLAGTGTPAGRQVASVPTEDPSKEEKL